MVIVLLVCGAYVLGGVLVALLAGRAMGERARRPLTSASKSLDSRPLTDRQTVRRWRRRDLIG